MKRSLQLFLLFILVSCNPIQNMAQNNFEYNKAWQEVETSMKAGKPKTALATIENILAAAKKQKNEPQMVKALVFRARTIQLTEEEAFLKNIASLEKEIQQAQQPAQQILYSITAGLYQQYFNNQRWKIYNRSNTTETEPQNPETWSVADFNRKISLYYEKALQNPGVLQKTKLDAYDPILDTGNMRHLRPTLFDLLAFESLTYFKSTEADIIRPAYAFQLSDAAALADVKTFLRYTYSSKDSSSNIFRAIRIYQDILQFHLNDANPAALIDANIERLQFAYENSTYPGKATLYKEALEKVYQQYPKQPEAMQAGYLLANWWFQQGESYDKSTGKAEDRLAFQTALGYCRDISARFPKSEGGMNAANLLRTLQTSSLSAQVEKVNVIDKPFRALVSFKNVSKAYFRIVSLPLSNPASQTDYEDEMTYWKRITKLPALKSWSLNMPQTDDLREHSTEIKIDALPGGSYLLIASDQEDFKTGDHPLVSVSFYVSNISYVQNGKNFFVLHREQGKPVPKAKVQVWYKEYDYSLRRNVSRKGENYTTDDRGYFIMNQGREQYAGSVLLEISNGNDYLFTEDRLPRIYSPIPAPQKSASRYEEEKANYFFFTDRSIYRPGQMLYFKAIGLTQDAADHKSKLYRPDRVEITLLNANYEEVATQTISPNEYASISGKFMLPATGLTGSFQLQIKQGDRIWQQSVQVEEYKRPKFYVSFDPLTGTYRLNDTIRLNGKALGYAGNVIDGAKVTYRVSRTTRFLYPWYFSNARGGWPPYQQGNEMEITNGTQLTKADGSFEIAFKALPDLSVDAKTDPGFDFSIEAVVTDINGETRTENTIVTVGYKSLLVNMNLPQSTLYPVDSALTIGVNTTNLNGEQEPAKVNLTVYALENPERLIRKRLWEAPDTYLLSREAFLKEFPNDPYQQEDDYRNWTKSKAVLSFTLNTAKDIDYRIAKNQLAPGYYRIEANSTDKDGGKVQTVGYIALFDAGKGILPGSAYLTDYNEKGSIEPGQTASFWQGTSVSDAYIIQQTVKSNKGSEDESAYKESFDYLKPQNKIQRYLFDAKETDRGGYQVNRVMIYHNRIYTQTWMVEIPWTNKELNISFETFRNKLLPGENETWKVKISGQNKDKAAAELLAGMYDASLDQFQPHQWTVPYPWRNNYFYNNWNANTIGAASSRNKYFSFKPANFDKRYDQLISLKDNAYGNEMAYRIRGVASAEMQAEDKMMAMSAPPPAPNMSESENTQINLADTVENSNKTEDKKTADIPVQIRKNFNETAFFFPDLKTDAEGNVSFSFTMPEALTTWKLQLLAHTTDARFAYATQNVVTQKQLMILPNPPRFFRQGDEMELSVKLSNLTDKELTGQIQLELLNASTGQPVDGWFRNVFPNQYFTVAAGQSNAVKFPIEIPYLYDDAVIYRLIARSGDISDGEEMALPVLTNKILVTESFPINLRSSSGSFDWKRFAELNDSKSGEGIENHRLTFEYTTNPAWYAVQALPYLMEYPYDCAEQTWNRYYANALATKIANSTPKIKAIFESWKNLTPEALQSNLEKNTELKSALLEETPWVLDAKNEAAQKKNIGLLFDLVRMQQEAAAALSKLSDLQSSNGGFVWFKGGTNDRYMTQYILTGIGHLKKLKAWPAGQQERIQNMIRNAVPYLDARMTEDYNEIVKSGTEPSTAYISHFIAQYLYMRSFFTEIPVATKDAKAFGWFMDQAEKNWLKLEKYDQGMIALAMFRQGKTATAKAILASLTEYSIQDAEFGMYWKEFNNPGWYWWQAPVESHALLTEAYAEIENNAERIDDLKTWLLKQKQTTNWKTTKATAEACYALLLSGTDWLQQTPSVVIKAGNYTLDSRSEKTEAGTGYFKAVVPKEKMNAGMGKIEVTLLPADKNQPVAKNSTSWGAAYWQYFQDADQVSSAASKLAIKKDLYIVRNTDRGPVLEKLEEGKSLKVGDRIKVRVEIRNDRQLEYVHLKDMRASCFEPVNVISGYRYQGGLGYYEATKDASSNFFIGYLPRGTWVFEYEMMTTHSGQFSNGITTLQSMYAPEFSSHSKGMRVNVD